VKLDNIATSVANKQYDCGISAIAITADQRKTVDFSDPYYEMPGVAVVIGAGETKINALADPTGRKVVAATDLGWVALQQASGLKSTDISHTTQPIAALGLLKSGTDSAVVGGRSVLAPLVTATAADYKFAAFNLSDPIIYGIVISKDRKPPIQAINVALGKIRADGRYQTIYNKCFIAPETIY
jgi:ABC-type amino acid transport substrate-binding protein